MHTGRCISTWLKTNTAFAAPVTMSFFNLHGVTPLFSSLCADHSHAVFARGAKHVQHGGEGNRLMQAMHAAHKIGPWA